MKLSAILQKDEEFQFIEQIVQMLKMLNIKDRLIPVEWEGYASNKKEYNVDIEINGFDRRGLLNEVLAGSK